MASEDPRASESGGDGGAAWLPREPRGEQRDQSLGNQRENVTYCAFFFDKKKYAEHIASA
jgi:hypothetical protein